IDELVTKYRNEIGMQPRSIIDHEIVQRCVYALVNEGARILEEGIALRASDIDVVYLTGYGFPPAKGGPMFYAQSVGLKSVVNSMRAFAQNDHADAKFWQPAKLLLDACESGQWPR
ncbi:MAG TPA: 3-hydroxyacyl-CoA dehydrogenase family protein, partial [Burkholderiaceae bacterium]|nr:3-hydroxyacyl-CoA dehydrogenase family protein [Burkholderiaceae bacterium]